MLGQASLKYKSSSPLSSTDRSAQNKNSFPPTEFLGFKPTGQADYGLYVTDGKAYTLGVSRNYEDITGICQGEVLGRHMGELVKSGFFDQSVSLLVIREKRSITIPQRILKTRTNVIVTGNPVFDELGHLSMIITVVRPRDRVESALERQDAQQPGPQYLKGIICVSETMQEIVRQLIRIAPFNCTVLIEGESGVGKEEIARALHYLSPRRNGPFVRVNVAAIPRELFESEFFGYKHGAFTGAAKQGKPGLIKTAHGGTLFLDEVAELPLECQAKLLRVIQDQELLPIGSNAPEHVDVRFIAATNVPLAEAVLRGKFRQDLYYRLNLINIYIPPLRERREDIPALAEHFLKRSCEKYGIIKKFEDQAVNELLNYWWPGNVRELQNLIERLVLLDPEVTITRHRVADELARTSLLAGAYARTGAGKLGLREETAELEKICILEALRKTGFSATKAAKLLGVHRTTLVRKARRYGLLASD